MCLHARPYESVSAQYEHRWLEGIGDRGGAARSALRGRAPVAGVIFATLQC